MRTLLTLGLGAAAMYFFDPQQGRRRRARVRDQLTQAQRVLRERAQGSARDELDHRPVRTELEPDRPSDTPEGAHHLGR